MVIVCSQSVPTICYCDNLHLIKLLAWALHMECCFTTNSHILQNSMPLPVIIFYKKREQNKVHLLENILLLAMENKPKIKLTNYFIPRQGNFYQVDMSYLMRRPYCENTHSMCETSAGHSRTWTKEDGISLNCWCQSARNISPSTLAFWGMFISFSILGCSVLRDCVCSRRCHLQKLRHNSDNSSCKCEVGDGRS